MYLVETAKGVKVPMQVDERKFTGGRQSPSSQAVRKLNSDTFAPDLAFHFRLFLGHFATITVESPPRGRKSPFTSAHTGFAQRTTSFNTWLTMFS